MLGSLLTLTPGGAPGGSGGGGVEGEKGEEGGYLCRYRADIA